MPCAGPDTSAAVSASPSWSVSLPSTPGAATVSAVSSSVVYASPTATGAWFGGVTVMVTVAAGSSVEVCSPLLAV